VDTEIMKTNLCSASCSTVNSAGVLSASAVFNATTDFSVENGKTLMKLTKLVVILMVLLCCHWAIAQPSITLQPKNASASLGGTARFTVSVSSDPTNAPITFQWWFKEATLDAVANPSAATYRLSLTNVTLAEIGPYCVVVGDLSGSVTSQVAALTWIPRSPRSPKDRS
jgi:hypothetical protein